MLQHDLQHMPNPGTFMKCKNLQNILHGSTTWLPGSDFVAAMTRFRPVHTGELHQGEAGGASAAASGHGRLSQKQAFQLLCGRLHKELAQGSNAYHPAVLHIIGVLPCPGSLRHVSVSAALSSTV